jgi:hypothetical protein
VVVADDETDAMEATPHERADERRPGRALVVARAELESQHPALPVHGHAGGHRAGHRDHAPGLADLDVGGVEPQAGVCLARERPAAEGLDLGVERGAHPAHLAAADAVDADGPEEVVDTAGADPRHVRLLDNREQGPLGPPPGSSSDGK